MGISINGGMIVGLFGHTINIPEGDDLYDWAEDNCLDYMSLYYDAGCGDTVFGFRIDDISVNEIDKFADDVKTLGKRFKDLTGQDAMLFGMQDVC